VPENRIKLVNKHKRGNNEILRKEYIVKFTKAYRLRWYGQAERLQNQSTPKQIARVAIERKKEMRKTT